MLICDHNFVINDCFSKT